MTNSEIEDLVAWAAHLLVGLEVESPNFPWRTLRTPYRVFLAEWVLGRTRSDVVARIFEELVASFPDLRSLATAMEEDLVNALKPLGLPALPENVRRLQEAARYILEHHEGHIPSAVSDLLCVPGIGPYKAGAIAAFAYGTGSLEGDVNILRFLSRLTGLPMKHPTRGSKELRLLLPAVSENRGGPRPEVLLDFARLICRRKPRCGECPLLQRCFYFRAMSSPGGAG